MIPWHEGELLQWNLVNVHHFDGSEKDRADKGIKRQISITIVREKRNGEVVAITELGDDCQKTWDNLSRKVEALKDIWKDGGSRN